MHHYFSLLRNGHLDFTVLVVFAAACYYCWLHTAALYCLYCSFEKKLNWKCKKVSFLFSFSSLSLCDLIVCSFFSFFLVCAAGKQHNILVPRNQKLVYTEVYTNLQSWILAIRQLLNILHIGIAYVFKILSVFLKLSNLHVIKVVLEFTTKLPDQT